MAYRSCSNCGHIISEHHAVCPNCNHTFDISTAPPRANIVYLIQGLIFLAIGITALVLGFVGYPNAGWLLSVIGGGFFGLIGIASLLEYRKQVYRANLAYTDREAYDELLKADAQKAAHQHQQAQRLAEDKAAKQYNHYKYKCPMCQSNRIITISTAKKVISTEAFGLASKTIGKNYRCNDCDYIW